MNSDSGTTTSDIKDDSNTYVAPAGAADTAEGTGPVKVRSVSTTDASNNTATAETFSTSEGKGKGKATAVSSANEHLFSNNNPSSSRRN